MDPHGREEFPNGRCVRYDVVDLPRHDGTNADRREEPDTARGGRSPVERRRFHGGSAARSFHHPDPHTCRRLVRNHGDGCRRGLRPLDRLRLCLRAVRNADQQQRPDREGRELRGAADPQSAEPRSSYRQPSSLVRKASGGSGRAGPKPWCPSGPGPYQTLNPHCNL